MAKKTDTVTLELIKKVEEQKKQIAGAEKPQWITNCSFSYKEGSSNCVNIHVESNLLNLLNIAAFLRNREQAYNEVTKEFDVIDAPPFRWDGFTVDEWCSDLKTRINKIQIGAKKAKLESLEKRLNSVVSPELRAQMELEAIAAELGE